MPRSRSNAFEAKRPVRFIRLRGDVRRRGAWETGAGFVFISREEVTRRSERAHRDEDALLGIASAKKAGMDVVDVRQLEGYPNPEALFYDN